MYTYLIHEIDRIGPVEVKSTELVTVGSVLNIQGSFFSVRDKDGMNVYVTKADVTQVVVSNESDMHRNKAW